MCGTKWPRAFVGTENYAVPRGNQQHHCSEPPDNKSEGLVCLIWVLLYKELDEI